MHAHVHVRKQELENRSTVTLTNGSKEPGLLLMPWSMRLHKIGHEELVEKQRKGVDLKVVSGTTIVVVVLGMLNDNDNDDDDNDNDNNDDDNEVDDNGDE